MFLPTIFKNKKCQCGEIIEEDSIREIAVSIKDGKFLIRFNCPECGLAGKLTFSNGDGNVVEFSKAILKEADDKKSLEMIKQSEFYREKLGCLYIPQWTDESYKQLCSDIDNICF